MHKRLGEKITLARKNKGYTQQQLATKIGCDQVQISALETTYTPRPNADRLVLIGDVLNVTTDYLLKDELELHPDKRPEDSIFFEHYLKQSAQTRDKFRKIFYIFLGK